MISLPEEGLAIKTVFNHLKPNQINHSEILIVQCRLHSALPWWLQEVRGTAWGPWVETSRSSPRNTPSTPNPILDSVNFGTVKFPLRDKSKATHQHMMHQRKMFMNEWDPHRVILSCSTDTKKGTGFKSTSLIPRAGRTDSSSFVLLSRLRQSVTCSWIKSMKGYILDLDILTVLWNKSCSFSFMTVNEISLGFGLL